MTEWTYPTAFTSWGAEEHAAIARVVRSGRFTMGAEVEAFEHELAAYHGVKHAIAVNSGSSANLVAIAALTMVEDFPLHRGDRVMVPALAWPTLYAPLVQHGMKLLLMDCDYTWNAGKGGVYPVTDVAMIVGCSVLGNPAHLPFWAQRSKESFAFMIEDNCESFGARLNGKLCGTFGRLGTLSFFYSHQISAIEGGAIITDDDEVALLARLIRNHGWTRGTGLVPTTFAGEYDFRVMGYNVRPLELHCAIAREQLKRINTLGLERGKNYMAWIDATADLPIRHPEIIAGAVINPFGFAFTVQTKAQRDKVALALRAAGIDCRPPAGGSFAKHSYARQANHSGDTPIADQIHDTGLFLGNAPFGITDLIGRAVNIIRRSL